MNTDEHGFDHDIFPYPWMKMLGVDVGPARLPNSDLPPEQVSRLRGELEAMGFFDWLK